MRDYKIEIEEILKKNDLSGVALVKRGDEVIYHGAMGYAHIGFNVKNNINTRFDTASITKIFTVVAIFQLVDKGIITLKQKVLDLIDIGETTISKDVTLYQLMTHSSGIGDDADEESGEEYSDLFKEKPNYSIRDNKDFLQQFKNKEPIFKPGEGCRYNNVAFILLGLVIEKVSGIGYREYVEENIFKSCSMNNTEFCSMDGIFENVAEGYVEEEDEDGNVVEIKKNIYSYPPIGSGDSGAYTTAEDLDKFFYLIRSGKLLSKESTEKILAPQILYKALEETDYYMGFGLEFSLWKDGNIRFIQKDGGNDGVTSLSTYYPESDIAITILINRNRDEMKMRNEIISLFTKNLESERLFIRNFKTTDINDFYEYMSLESTAKYEDFEPLTYKECIQWIEERIQLNNIFAVILKDSGKMIGDVNFSQGEVEGTYEIGYDFNENFWNKGYATEACITVIDYIFNEIGGRRVYALCNDDNFESIKLLERIGMRREGQFIEDETFKKDDMGNPIYINTYLYAIIKKEWNNR